MAELDQVYKALRLIPEFDGNVNVLTRFVSLCDEVVDEFIQKYPTNKLISIALVNGILNKITGQAARLINSNGISTDWTDVRKALINNFADHRDETALYNDLSLLTQGPGSPQEFYERCQNLFSTIMTYVSLHDTIQTTIDAKRDLYRKLTLQSYLRGLKDPLGSRIRCMRPESIEKALEFVNEEQNTLYLQQRNDQFSDRRSQVQSGPKIPLMSGFSVPQNKPFTFNMPQPKPFQHSMPGPSKMQFGPPMTSQWRPNYNQMHQAGPSRTQQMFRAAPPNYNPNAGFRAFAPRVLPQQNRPMSGVSNFMPKTLPPSSFIRGHDYMKSGNPPPNNYFRTREMNFNDCINYDPCYEEYCTDYNPYYENTENLEYFTDYESQLCLEYPEACYEDPNIYKEETPQVPQTQAQSNDQNFQKLSKSDKRK